MTAPVHPAFYRFAAMIGAVIGVAALSAVAGFVAAVKIFAPKQEEGK